MTRRAVLLGLALLVVLVPTAFYLEIAWNRADMFVGVPSMTPVVLLFVLTAAAGLPLFRRIGLTRRELLVVYSMVLVAGPLIGATTMAWMLCGTIHYYYMSRIYVIWQSVFLPHVPTWFAPTDPGTAEAFFLGESLVPWVLWWKPLVAWGSFALGLFVCALCIISVLQRQWISNERLSFPIAQMPLEMVSEGRGRGGEGPGRLPRSWMFWAGVLVSFGITLVNALAWRWPSIPSIPLGPLPLMREQRVGPLGGIGEITLVLWPWMIAIAYLIPKELSFSAWFFWWLLVGANVAGVFAGTEPRDPSMIWDSGFPAPRFQGGGALLAIGLWGLWIARSHLVRAVRVALSRRSGEVDAEEPLSYRLALIGMVVTFAGLVYFDCLAGARAVVAIALVGGILAYYIVWARLRAETGLGFSMFPIELEFVLNTPLGSSFYRVRETVIIMSTRWAYGQGFGTIYEVCTGNALDTFKIADASGIDKRRLTKAMLAGFVVTLVLGLFVMLTGIYRYGWFGLRGLQVGWLGPQSIGDGGRIIWRQMYPTNSDVNGLIAICFGAAFALFLGVMRLRFWWWPFHPVGYMAGMCWGLNWYWMPFFVGWACKTLVVRYGGLRLYRSTVPMAIGFIVGDLLNKGVWALVGLVTLGQV
ncbi:MAG: hypothetical protein JSV79_09115 [Armatimonadota bacterium]|nr:MAG: hypothetical protein JSV79_09115 [Armatimonadota bacterium]